MSKDIAETNVRVSFTTGSYSRAEMDAAADALGYESRAELCREAVSEKIAQAETADGGEAFHTPENDALQEAYETLLRLSDSPTGTRRVPVAEAKGELFTTRTPKARVVEQLLKPLAAQGFIAVTNGRIRVLRRTAAAVADAEREAEAALDRLGAARRLPSEERATEHKQVEKYQRSGLDVPFRLGAWVAGRTVWSDEALSA